jgi:hypothetical protein
LLSSGVGAIIAIMLIRIALGIAMFAALAAPTSVFFPKISYCKNRRSDTPLFRFEKNGLAGFIDADGKVIIPPKFDVGWFAEEDFVEGLSPARSGHNWGFIDTKGNWVIEAKYKRVEHFADGLAFVTGHREGNDYHEAYIDKSGATIIDFPKGVWGAHPFSEGMAAVMLSLIEGTAAERLRDGFGKLGYIDRTGRLAIPYQFAAAGPFREGLAAVAFNGQCYFEGRNGWPRMLSAGVVDATPLSGGLQDFSIKATEARYQRLRESITERCGEGFIDKTGKAVFRFQGAHDFSEGLAAAEDRDKWGFIGHDGAFRVRPEFEDVGPFSNGLARASVDGKWGYVDSAGQWKIRPRFKEADDFSDGLARADSGYIDKSGTRVVSTKGTAFVQGLAHIKLGTNRYGYIDHTGRIVFRYRAKPGEPLMTY